MQTIVVINFIITLLFFLCYTYQYLYIPIPWIDKSLKVRKAKTAASLQGDAPKIPSSTYLPSGNDRIPGLNHYAALICARNEENVIGDLIDSLQAQTYPADLLSVFVMADNSSDYTAVIARDKGVHVYERFNKHQVGKGYALQTLMQNIHRDYPDGFDGYFVFDADNILSPTFVEAMDRSFCAPLPSILPVNEAEYPCAVTSYRNSKNYGSNWISAGYALWFLRESRYLSHPRMLIGSSCAVSGTGFLFSREVAEEIVDWPFHMLTEDIEFSIHQITRGKRIGFCPDAELFDEQPIRFSQSWRQRLRWSRGYLQVFQGYGKKLILGIFQGKASTRLSCFDMCMTIMPAFILSAFSVLLNLTCSVMTAIQGKNLMIGIQSVGELLFNMYLILFVMGLITTISEWNRIHTTTEKKILYLFTFPIFMFTYLPIALASLVYQPGWKPIEHTMSQSVMAARRG